MELLMIQIDSNDIDRGPLQLYFDSHWPMEESIDAIFRGSIYMGSPYQWYPFNTLFVIEYKYYVDTHSIRLSIDKPA